METPNLELIKRAHALNLTDDETALLRDLSPLDVAVLSAMRAVESQPKRAPRSDKGQPRKKKEAGA